MFPVAGRDGRSDLQRGACQAGETLNYGDVRYHLERLNEERGHVADAELARFKVGCRTVSNLIKAEVSGNRGEREGLPCVEVHKESALHFT